MQRNKQTRTLGFDKKAFYKEELKKKKEEGKKSSGKNDIVKSGFEKPDQQLAPIEVTFHPEELELGGSADASTNICLSWEFARTRHRQGYRNTATQSPPRRVSHCRTAGDEADYSSSKMPMTE